MRNKATIESMLLLPSNLPTAGDGRYHRYAADLRIALKANISGVEDVQFCASSAGEKHVFNIEWKRSRYTMDSFPNLKVERWFEIDPTLPLMPQIVSIQSQIHNIEEKLTIASRAIARAIHEDSQARASAASSLPIPDVQP